MKAKFGVIVIGGHVQGLGITRILGKLGLPIIIVDDTVSNLARHSRYCVKFFKYKHDDLFNFLIELGSTGDYKKYVVLPTNDSHVAILSQNKTILSDYFTIGTDNWEVVSKLYNKRLTYTIARNLEIPIANTWFPESINDVTNVSIEFPCIIKPAVMHGFYSHFKKKVFICNNRNSLIENYKKAIRIIPSEQVILQEIIPGSSHYLYSACFFFDGVNALNSFVGRRARQHPHDFGNATTFAQIVDMQELIDISIKLLKNIEYKGICEVEYKYDTSDHQFKLLEVNPRTWKWHSITEKAEVNLLENYFNYLTEGNTKIQSHVRKATFRHLITDLPMVVNYKKLGIYKKYRKYSVQYAVWDFDDLKPTIFQLIYLPLLIWKR